MTLRKRILPSPRHETGLWLLEPMLREILGGMLSNHLTHAQWSLIICARSRIGRGETMGTTGRSVFPFPIFPRAHLLRASLANILTNFLLEILPKNRLLKVSQAFFWSLPGQKEPKLPETLFYKSSTSLPKFEPDAKYPLPIWILPASFTFVAPFFKYVFLLLGVH